MKTLIIFSTLLAFIFHCQAETVMIKLQTIINNNEAVKGIVTGQVLSKDNNNIYDFEINKNLLGTEDFYYIFYSGQEIESIKLKWQTSSKVPLELKPIPLTVYYDGGENNDFVFVPANNKINDGETIVFKRYKSHFLYSLIR